MAFPDPAAQWARASTNAPNTNVHGPLPLAGIATDLQVLLAQLQQAFLGILEQVYRELALAFGAVEIFGWNPYEFLVDTGEHIAKSKSDWDTLFSELAVGDITGLLFWLNHIPADVIDGVTAVEQAILNAIGAALGHAAPPDRSPSDIQGYLTNILANLNGSGVYDALAGFQNQATSLFKYLTATGGNIGQFNAAQLQGALNTALTYGGTGLTTFFTNINSSGNLLASGLTGGLNSAVTYGGTALTTFFGNINSSGNLLAAGVTGGLNTTAVTIGGVQLGTLVTNINSSGALLASGLTGAFNTAVTFGGTAASSLFQYLNSSGQFSAAQLTGALSSAVTFGGTALSTFFGNINSSGNLLASGLTGALGTGLTVGGTTLGTLFTNINSSGLLLASGITGALGAGLTVAGTTLGTLFTNINSSGQLLLAGATGAINTGVTIAGNSVSTLFSGSGLAGAFVNGITTTEQQITNGIYQGINNAAPGLNQAATTVATNLGGMVAGFFNSFLGGGVPAASTTQATGAMATKVNNDLANTLAINALQLQPPSVTALLKSVFDFASYSAGSLPGSWSVTQDATRFPSSTGGSLQIVSGILKYVRSAGTSNNGYIARSTTPTLTDYQEVSWTWSGELDHQSGSTAQGVIFRANSGMTTFCRFWTQPGGSWVVTAYAASVNLGALNPTLVPGRNAIPGAKYTLRAGDSSSNKNITLLENGQVVATWTDPSNLATIGASNRYAGPFMGDSNTSSSASDALGVPKLSISDQISAPGANHFSDRPASGSTDLAGRLYFSDDCGRIDRDNGVSWDNMWAGPLTRMTAPPSAGWSSVNAGSSTFAADKDALLLTAPSSTRNWRLAVRTLTPSSNYTATTFIEAAGIPPTSTNRWYTGIGLRNSSSGSFITFGPSLYSSSSGGSTLTLYRWTSATVFSALSFEQSVFTIHGSAVPNWYRIRDDGTNRYFEYSVNGVDWITILSEGRTVFITPDQFCFGADNEGSGADCKIRLRSLAGIS